ncbi:hypothetical protein AVEN_217207-1 [Araneus ventricosus]|uniref:Uncharacterized protein n=1 Tax=Araneus ventricosus TaxID=182803 RepID=A0A4Y2QZX4_ARAVE|nr:hypothetical protein AVEN_217207-1 [Araneus ventricosus]
MKTSRKKILQHCVRICEDILSRAAQESALLQSVYQACNSSNLKVLLSCLNDISERLSTLVKLNCKVEQMIAKARSEPPGDDWPPRRVPTLKKKASISSGITKVIH